MDDRPCDQCIWYSPNGCVSWDCEPVTRKEVREIIKEYKEMKGEQK